jgi:hypothetical protein
MTMTWLIIFLFPAIIAILVYLWFLTIPQTSRIAILSEKSVREQADLEQSDISLANTLNSRVRRMDEWYVVVPTKSQEQSRIPSQIYEGESDLIVLHPQLDRWGEDDALLAVDLQNRVENKKLAKLKQSRAELENYAVLQLTRHKFASGKPKVKYAQYLSIEIIAAGFEVDGEKKQKQDLHSQKLTYTWGITAKNSGNHKIGFSLKVEDAEGKELAQLGTAVHPLKVVSIMRLTQRQLRILVGSAGAITTVLTILQALQALKIIP